MLTKVYGSAVFGVEATTITVEVNVDKGIGYHLVGLPDNAIRESNFRIAASLQNNGYKIPGKKLILNMSPADMRKEGSAYDLTLAMGILVATGQIEEKNSLDEYIIMGNTQVGEKTIAFSIAQEILTTSVNIPTIPAALAEVIP